MEEAHFLALINAATAAGQYVLGFVFDNSGRMLFGPNTPHPMFSISEYYDPTTKCLVDPENYDTFGRKYTVYKPIATIQSTLITAPGNTLNDYDVYGLVQ